MSSESAKPAKSNEEVVTKFQMLRSEQRNMADNVGQYEMDLKEHRCDLTSNSIVRTNDEERKMPLSGP